MMHWLKQNWIKIGVGILILVILLFLMPKWDNSPTSTIKSPLAEIAHSQVELCKAGAFSSPLAQEIDFNKGVVKDRFVQYLRIALDNWLSRKYGTATKPETSYECLHTGLLDGKQCPDGAFDDGDYENGLSKISQDYLKSKFVVLQTDPAPGGGESIVLIFKDKPDKAFYAWVYRYWENDPLDPKDIRGFDLRALNEYDLTENQAPSLQETQKMFINQLCGDFGI